MSRSVRLSIRNFIEENFLFQRAIKSSETTNPFSRPAS